MSGYYTVEVITDKGEKVKIDPDQVLDDLTEYELLDRLEQHFHFEWRSPNEFDDAVDTAVAKITASSYKDYDDIANSFWHGDFSMEKLLEALGKDGVGKLREMIN